MSLIVTGIGNRTLSDEAVELIISVAVIFRDQNWILRSGGADGADTIWEEVFVNHRREIYLPWKGFNGKPRHLPYIWDIPAKAAEMAEFVHPNWEACSSGARKLHARNVCQVLGLSLHQPSDLVVVYDANPGPYGGSKTAIRRAEIAGVPVINLADPDGLDKVKEFFKNACPVP